MSSTYSLETGFEGCSGVRQPHGRVSPGAAGPADDQAIPLKFPIPCT